MATVKDLSGNGQVRVDVHIDTPGGSGGSLDSTQLPTALGRFNDEDSLSTALSNEDKAALDLIGTELAAATTSASVAPDTSTVYVGVTPVTPKFAVISSAASADVVALVASKKIRVLSLFFVTSTFMSIKFQTGATTDITGALPLGANGGLVLPFNPVGWFETAAGAKLNIVLSVAAAVAGGLTYIEV
jgi:hypothetical protein